MAQLKFSGGTVKKYAYQEIQDDNMIIFVTGTNNEDEVEENICWEVTEIMSGFGLREYITTKFG